MPPPTARILETKLNPPAAVATQVPRTAIGDEHCRRGHREAGAGARAGRLRQDHRHGADARAHGGAGHRHRVAHARPGRQRRVALSGNCLAEAVQRLGVEEPRANGPFDAVAALAAHDAPFTLFLDDFERVQEPAVLGLVREIVEHLPRGGQIVIGSRSLPDLGLGRLRARGQLMEIDTDRLRFSLEETSAFFSLRTAPADARCRWTCSRSCTARPRAGWRPSGWRRWRWSGTAPRPVLSNASRAPTAPWPTTWPKTCSRTSRRRFATFCCAPASCASSMRRCARRCARAPTARPSSSSWPRRTCSSRAVGGDAKATAATAMPGATTACSPTSCARSWRASNPGEIERLHLAASGWYESHDRPVPAIDHAIEGGDHPYALTLLDSYAAQFLEQGRMRMLARWFSAIPEHQLRAHPFLQPIALWATCFTHGPWDAMRQLEQSGCLDSPIAEVRASAHTLVPLLLAMQDRHDEAYEAGRQSLARMPTGLAFADSVLLNAMAHILAVRGDPHEARRMLEAAREQGSSTFNRMYTESLAGLFDLHEGRLRQATARLRMAVDSTHAVSYNHSHGNAWAGVLYAGAVYETNQLVQAEHLLNVYLPLARDVGLPDHMILSHVMRSRMAFHAGDIDAAFQALTELEYLGHHRQLPRVVASAKLERSRMLLLQGNGPASHDELLRADDPALWERERRQRLPAHDLDYLALAKARWDIAFGDARAALAVLDAELHARAGLGAQPARAQAEGAARAGAATHRRHGRGARRHRRGAADREPGRIRAADPRRGGRPWGRWCTGMRRRSTKLPASRGGNSDPILADYLQRLLQADGPDARRRPMPRPRPATP
jgi:LuxR family maltose regulon positive regulatory protein